jgi:hypothetical protein
LETEDVDTEVDCDDYKVLLASEILAHINKALSVANGEA